jgi:hypothetical protein
MFVFKVSSWRIRGAVWVELVRKIYQTERWWDKIDLHSQPDLCVLRRESGGVVRDLCSQQVIYAILLRGGGMGVAFWW